ncbi:MAG: preprotein translocase subunit YajC [Candidatus Limimorpha sp.]
MNLLTILFILLADAPNAGKTGWMNIIFILLLVVIFWLFFIRPQTKRAKEQAKFRNELKKGDKVVTIGGFHGRIVEVKETTVMLSIAPDITVEIEKSALVQNSSQVGQG